MYAYIIPTIQNNDEVCLIKKTILKRSVEVYIGDALCTRQIDVPPHADRYRRSNLSSHSGRMTIGRPVLGVSPFRQVLDRAATRLAVCQSLA